MTEFDQNNSSSGQKADRLLAALNYVLCFLAISNGVTLLLAAAIAYIRKDQSSEITRSHFQYQIATFLYGLVIAIIGFFTLWFFGLGLLIWFLGSIWLVIKTAIGLVRLIDGRGHDNPNNFLF